jgi:hypothetical protein
MPNAYPLSGGKSKNLAKEDWSIKGRVEDAMRITRFLAKITAASAPMIALARAGSFTASGFVGKWKSEDTSGKPFTIWLSDDGTAEGDRSGEGLSGMWRPKGNAAVITWDSGWVTKIAKEGNTYKQTVLENGQLVGSPSNAETGHSGQGA